ncbi:sarcosine oxidase subunit delta [Azospirillum sp. ST 5-10]|uniref:sarcosine oxidase subunit delta n=1 Tax=unclassified Azospirillum TaxID=2630922 RepID=UPI003F4A812A
MLLITCPWCGPRDETEFCCGGEAHRVRPADPAALSDAQWADFLFMRRNPKGAHRERWVHSHGCRRWFNVERHTVTHEILRVYTGDGTTVAPAASAEPELALAAERGGR